VTTVSFLVFSTGTLKSKIDLQIQNRAVLVELGINNGAILGAARHKLPLS